MAEILAFLHACNPLLKDSELIYLAVGESYVRRLRDLPVDYLSEEEDKSPANSLKSKTKKSLLLLYLKYLQL